MGRRARPASKPEPRMKVGAAPIAIAPYILYYLLIFAFIRLLS